MDGVILLHGIGNRALTLAPMAWQFRKGGYRTLNLTYPSRAGDIGASAAHLHGKIAPFADSIDGQLHVVTHSMGGLVARAYIHRYRPARLGRVVMLAPPHGGSEVADLLQHNPLYRRVFGPAGQQLTTKPDAALQSLLGAVDYPLGIIAGDRSLFPVSVIPGVHDGKVSVASTRIESMSDHIVLHTTHTLMILNPKVIAQALHFLRHGRFKRAQA